MTLDQYITNINQRYRQGYATEHTFRGDLQQLLESCLPDLHITNEPKRQSCGAPDYIITKKDIPVGFVEAKDIADPDLDGSRKGGNKEQFDRYKASLDNLIFTDYQHFHLYRDGQFITKVDIAEIQNGTVRPLPENYQPAQKWLKDRKGRKLEFEDILHYQKIIVALTETDRLMKEIDEVGWA